MDGVTVEAARYKAIDRKEWRALVHMKLNEFYAAILFLPVYFRTAFPRSGNYHQEKGGMTLQDVVDINSKKGATTENQDADVKHVG